MQHMRLNVSVSAATWAYALAVLNSETMQSDLKTTGLANVLSMTEVMLFSWQKAATAGMSGISSKGLLMVSM